ncbi:MAG: sensor domain-containing diguanylate cyclase, partial [Candidatus Kryptoniota bacterium]
MEESSPSSTAVAEPPLTFAVKKEGPRFSIIDTFFFKPDEQVPSEPRAEFHSILHKLLELVTEVLFAHTTALFWVNRERNILVVADKLTNSKVFTGDLRLPLGRDVISRIALSGKPEIISEINPAAEKDVIPYYDEPCGVKSLIGVPIFYRDEVIAVLVADNLSDEGFGRETVPLLGNFTRLFTAVLRVLSDKYDLQVIRTTFNSLKWLTNEVLSKTDLASMLQSIMTAVSDTVDADFVTLVSEGEGHSYYVSQVVKRSGVEYVEDGFKVSIPDTLTGRSIKDNRIVYVEDLSKVEDHRFNHNEPVGKGSFISIPIAGFNTSFGAVTVESVSPGKFSSIEIDAVKQIVSLGAFATEVYNAYHLIEKFVTFDRITGSLNKKSFLERLDEEMGRVTDLGIRSAFVLISLDRFDDIRNRFSMEGVEYIMADIAESLRGWLKPYDAVGKISAHSFGVILEGFSQNEAFAWGEKFRKNLATKVYPIGNRNYMATVSIAVLNIDDKNPPTELLAVAQRVLQ